MMGDIVLDHRNRRIRVLDYAAEDAAALAGNLEKLAEAHGAGKIILYAREADLRNLLNHGWRLEGRMSGFFQGETAYCLTRYPDPERAVSGYTVQEDRIIADLTGRAAGDRHETRTGSGTAPPMATPVAAGLSSLRVRPAVPDDMDTLLAVFADVFATYPSPMEDRAYVEKLLASEDYLMLIAEENGQLAGIISGDIDAGNLCAEITDCVTLPRFRGRGVMGLLVDEVEKRLQAQGLKYLFSLARAGIAPINAVFHRRGYVYSGRLVNNCTIGGRFESMNIWEKVL